MNRKVKVSDCNLGKGIFAKDFIEAGETIAFITGRLMSRKEIDSMGEQGENSYQVDAFQYIFPTTPGLFMNHSCNPNAGVDSDLRIVALRSIAVGEEIRYDYSTSMLERCWTMKCRCGEPNCRKIIDDFDRLPRSVRDFYLNRHVVQDFIVAELSDASRVGESAA